MALDVNIRTSTGRDYRTIFQMWATIEAPVWALLDPSELRTPADFARPYLDPLERLPIASCSKLVLSV